MNGTTDQEYRRLALESSDQLMEWDGLCVLGRYAEAAHAARRAGEMRQRMGQLRHDAGDFAGAAEDWLSAAACYLQASAEAEASTVVQMVRRLEEQGRIPPERRDLPAILRQRERELQDLARKFQDFRDAFSARGFKVGVAEEEVLAFLVQQLQDMPGDARLHFLIWYQCQLLGHRDRALSHSRWAMKFAPENSLYVDCHLLELTRAHRWREVKELAASLLGTPLDSAEIRLLLVVAIAGDAGDITPSICEEMIAVMRPILERPETSVEHRAQALLVTLAWRVEMDQTAKAAPLFRQLEELEEQTEDPALKNQIAEGRRKLSEYVHQRAQARAATQSLPNGTNGQSLFALLTDFIAGGGPLNETVQRAITGAMS